jgi:NAD(P)-dependent dehydrogenase (short-subunit alcohol dehydrogenase family)
MDQQTALLTDAREFAGPAAVQGLKQAGFHVACHDRSFSQAAARDAFVAANPGSDAVAEQEPERLVERVLAAYGAIEAAVINDWHPVNAGPIEEVSLEQYRSMLDTLMVRPFRLLKALVPNMKQRRRGCIILITSAAVLNPPADYVSYTSARAGAMAMALGLAKELAPFNVQVNAIAPHFLYGTTYFPGPRWANWEQDTQMKAIVEKNVPMKRFGRPEEMAELIALLASGKAAYLSGQTIKFAGAWS